MSATGSGVNVAEVSRAEQREALLFELAGQRFALPLAGVIELTRAYALQSLPKAPRPVLGVLNLRGDIVPVIDLRQRFELPDKALEPGDYFVFAWVGERRVALRVDGLLGIEWLTAQPIGDAPNLALRHEHLAGVAAVADGIILIYDLATFLSDSEAKALDSALALHAEAES